MRGPFGSSRGIGGGSGMLRTVQRAAAGGVGGGAVQEPFSHSTTTVATASSASTATSPTKRPSYKSRNSSNTHTLSSPTVLPISAASTAPAWPPACSSPTYSSDEFDWECVEAAGDESVRVVYDDFVFGSVPSKDEVHYAVSAIQDAVDTTSFSQFIKNCNSDKDVGYQSTNSSGSIQRFSSSGSERDWIEPSLQICSSGMLRAHGPDRVYEAFHLLQTEPSIQRMVVSLSSDRAVWDAVLNNEVVRELRESLNEAENSVDKSSDEGPDGSKGPVDLLTWIFVNTKAKLVELVENITKMVNQLFQSAESEKGSGATDPFDEKLRTSLLLSVVVLLVVVVTRAHGA